MTVYLDNAATSFPKPDEVYRAVDDYQRCNGAAAGRGGYRAAREAESLIDRARRNVARLFGSSAARIVFTLNGTDSLNLALHGFLRPGDHVVTTMLEHNSVLRPLAWLREHREITVSYVPVGEDGRVSCDNVRRAITSATRLVCMTHASNVTGIVQPIAEIGEMCREQDVRFLVDAAQTTGHLAIDLANLPVDMLACPGHKGLLGPLGTGVLYLSAEMDKLVEPVRLGGTGTQSESETPPIAAPTRYEAGNLNVLGLAGLAASTEWLLAQDAGALHRHECALREELASGLSTIPGVTVFHANCPETIGVLSFAVNGYGPQEVATILDENFDIACRAGFHCAPRVHQALGTFDRGGTVRFSVGPFTQPEDIQSAIEAMRQIATG